MEWHLMLGSSARGRWWRPSRCSWLQHVCRCCLSGEQRLLVAAMRQTSARNVCLSGWSAAAEPGQPAHQGTSFSRCWVGCLNNQVGTEQVPS